MKMRLVRDNDDPKLLSDLERLAGGEPAVLEPADESVGDVTAIADRDGAIEPLDDPFVLRFVQVSMHLKRYGPFYLGAAAWALVMLLIQPVGRGSADTEVAGPAFAGAASVQVAPASADSPVADFNSDAIGAPTFEAVTSGSSFSAADAAFGDFSESSFESSSEDFSSTTPTTSPTFEETAAPTFADDFGAGEEDEEVSGFSIVRSGYASSTGGTPAEQEPAKGGLPVAVTLGSDTKRSFIELAGTDTELRLKQSPDGAIQPDVAVIKACLITSPWKAERKQPLSASPTFDPACSTGARFQGIWTFDLSSFPAEELKNGIVLTPGPGTGLTFQIVFEPTPIPASGA